jgi:AraC-like DNA-binding protein
VEKIKTTIITMIHHHNELPSENYSVYISKQVGHSYTQLATIFSESQGITIEHFIIAHKIEKVKELLLYGELSLTQIADKLHYSSVAHLSNQFKKVTGITPSRFKIFHTGERNMLENIF